MRLNPVFASQPTSIFEEMSGLARLHGALNVGQGFPDTQGPEDLRLAAGAALLSGTNQYPPMRGIPALRSAVADHYRRLQGLDLSPDNVTVTSGATEALAAAIFALAQPGDEVIVLDPAYDAYRPLIAQAGGLPISLALRPPHWDLPLEAIAAAITPATRAILVNTPMNPTGRVIPADQLEALAQLAITHDLAVICDEVWEHVVFDGLAHTPMIGLPGMTERTVKIGSAGKMFSMTGWKVGFAIASGALGEAVAKAHQYLTFTTAPHLQEPVAIGLAWPDERFSAMRAGFQASRDRLVAGLHSAGFVTLPSEATYFVCVDLAASGIEMAPGDFCRWAVAQHGIAAIPVDVFHADKRQAAPLIRLCFAKPDSMLDEAVARLAAAKAAAGARSAKQ